MNKGITLIETIVAVTVLIMALGGPFLMAAKSLKTAGYAREEIVAARLAEEGLEVVHSVRDNNAAESDAASGNRAWDSLFSSNACITGCIVDITKQSSYAANTSPWDNASSYKVIYPCSGGCTGEKHRVYKHTSGLYRQLDLAEYGGNPPGGYTKTNMTRMVKITPVNVREYLVESIVTYYAGPNQKTIKLTDTIMNWFPAMDTLL